MVWIFLYPWAGSEESRYKCFDFWGHMVLCQEALGRVDYHHTASPVVQPDILAGNVNICAQMLWYYTSLMCNEIHLQGVERPTVAFLEFHILTVVP